MGKIPRGLIFLIVGLAIVFSSFLYSQERSLGQQDGGDWLKSTNNQFSNAYYIGYIAGVMMGTGVVNQEVKGTLVLTIKCIEGLKVNNELNNIIIKSTKAAQERVANVQMFGITVGQVSDGMNVFYSDFANRRIKIIDAIFIVKMQIDGRDPDLIQAQIRYLRMPKMTQEESNRFDKKMLDGKETITEEEWLKQGSFTDKNNISHRLFRYGDYLLSGDEAAVRGIERRPWAGDAPR